MVSHSDTPCRLVEGFSSAPKVLNENRIVLLFADWIPLEYTSTIFLELHNHKHFNTISTAMQDNYDRAVYRIKLEGSDEYATVRGSFKLIKPASSVPGRIIWFDRSVIIRCYVINMKKASRTWFVTLLLQLYCTVGEACE